MKRLLVLVALAATATAAFAARKPKYVTPSDPVPGEALIVAPTPGITPSNMPDANLPTYGIPPRPPAGAAPEDTANWNSAADLYPEATTEGSVTTPVPTPPPTPPAVIPPVVTPYGNSSQNDDCNTNHPCFAGVTARTTGNPISTASNYISFTVPYLVKRGPVCPTVESISIWVGNQYGQHLWQAGIIMSAQYNSSCALISWSYYPFYEDYPTQNTPRQVAGITLLPGDVVMITVWNTGLRTAKMQFSNITKAQQTTISYGTSYDMVNPYFLWKAETLAYPPKFGALQVRGIATDQSGKMYRAGDNTNGHTIISHMVNTGVSPNTWVPITGVGPGVFTFNGS